MNDLSRMLDPARIDMGEKLRWREMELLNSGSYPSVPVTRATASPPSALPRTCGLWLIAQNSGHL